MNTKFATSQFSFEYKEDFIDNVVICEKHCHTYFELIFVLEGALKVFVEGCSYFLSANHAIIIPSLSHHSVISMKKGTYKSMIVLFDETAIPTVLRPELASTRHMCPAFYSEQLRDLKKIMLLKGYNAFYYPLVDGIMIRTMYEGITAKKMNKKEDRSKILNQLLIYINEHLCEKIQLSDLALHTACSQSSVSHLFTKQMKISPKQYIIQKKLAMATLLIHNGTPPTVAALKLGYDNYSDFYRLYTKYLHKKPREKN